MAKAWVWFGLLGLLAMAQEGSWSRLSPLGQPRQEVGAAEVGGKIYVVGGFAPNGTTLGSAEVYDPATERWQNLPPMPVAVNHPAAVGLQGKLWVLGGYREGLNQPTETVQIFDPATGRWSLGSPLPTARGALGAAVLDGKIYAIGGARGSSLGDAAVYDPALGQWKELPAMPTPRNHLGVAALKGKVYAAGGRNTHSFTLGTLEAFDPASGKWETLTPMPTRRSGHAAAAVGNCLYILGGEGNRADPRGMFPQVEVYRPAQQAWQRLPDMPIPKHGIYAAVLGGKIYLAGGATQQGLGAVNLVEVFAPPRCD